MGGHNNEVIVMARRGIAGSDRGATAVEYGLVIAGIGIVVLASVLFLGRQVSSSMSAATTSLAASSQAADAAVLVAGGAPVEPPGAAGQSAGGGAGTGAVVADSSGSAPATPADSQPAETIVAGSGLQEAVSTAGADPSSTPVPGGSQEAATEPASPASATPVPSGPTPTVLRIGPSSGPTVGGATVRVEGRDFLPGATVAFGSQVATVVSREERWNGEVRLIVITPDPSPAGAPAQVAVTVRNPNGQEGTAGEAYRYRAPWIASVSPSSVSAAGGTEVTVTGNFFVPGATVTIGGAAATVVSQSADANTLVIRTPPGTAGATTLRLTNPDGVAGTKPFAYAAE